MTRQKRGRSALILLSFLGFAATSSAQTIEVVGSRALGMGGAFVAVGNDSSATWWNPAALAAGPFLDVALARSVLGVDEELPAHRDRASWFAVGTPPFGLGYYRLRTTDIRPAASTADGAPDREDPRAGVPVRTLSASQFGITLVQTLFPGVHAGTTVKYVRGVLRDAREDVGLTASELLDRGEDLEGGDSDGAFDLDVGLFAVTGAVSVAAVVRNVREPEFGGVNGASGARMPRQVRLGAAFDGSRIDVLPLTVAIDVDVRTYETLSGARRVVAMGAEQWVLSKRLGLRVGARVNLAGNEDRVATGGASVALRSGLYLDGYVVGGGTADERGWGVAARVSF